MKIADSQPLSLRNLQQLLASQILHPERTELPEALLVPPPRGSIAERVGVYVNGYPARLQDSLSETFPALAHLIGHVATAELTQRYRHALSQHSYNLNDVGAELPAFLRRDELTARLPFLPDLAELEWAVATAFHAHDKTPLDPTSLAEWTLDDWAHAVLRFQPSVTLRSSQWPIRDLWETRETPLAEIDLTVADRPQWVLVHRANLQVHCDVIDDNETRALAALIDGRPLGEVTELLATHGDDPSRVSTWFTRWINLGLITTAHVQ